MTAVKSMRRRYKSKKKFTAYRMAKPIMFAVFVVYAVSLIVPFLWMFMNSFKSVGEFNTGNIFGFPIEWSSTNLIDVMSMQMGNGQTIFDMLLMSIVTTVLGTIISVGLSTIAAYVVAKYNFPGKKVILGAAIFTMIVPIIGTLPAQVRMLETFGMMDSLVGVLFLYSGCFGFNFIMLHSSFETISWSYAEAAQIDGANRFQIMFRIMLPLAKGPIIAICILQAIVLWNDYSTPFLFMNSNKTLAVGLQELQTGHTSEYPLVFSAVMVAVIPIFILFACFQKTIIKNTIAGGLKG
ncbi:MAG: carbohydrate ABC transporter permease [Clostridiales bacterium]|nr:carbohydrate ABC transporter permease [Clostridiales bacterium]